MPIIIEGLAQMKNPVDLARISRLVVPKYPHPITQRSVRSMAIFQTDEDRRAYLQFLAEEAERFGADILVCEVEPGAGWNRQEGLGLSVAQCFFSHGAQPEGPARERSAMGRLDEEVGRFFDRGDEGKGSSDTADDPNRAAGGECCFCGLTGTFNGSGSF